MLSQETVVVGSTLAAKVLKFGGSHLIPIWRGQDLEESTDWILFRVVL